MIFAVMAWNSLVHSGEIQDAAKSGNIAKVKVLLKDNPDLVSSIDPTNGATPLHWAVARHNMEMAELLLASKGGMNARDNKGETPLHLAAHYGYNEMAELLLTNKADVTARAINDATPLGAIELFEHKDVAQLLRKHGANT